MKQGSRMEVLDAKDIRLDNKDIRLNKTDITNISVVF